MGASPPQNNVVIQGSGAAKTSICDSLSACACWKMILKRDVSSRFVFYSGCFSCFNSITKKNKSLVNNQVICFAHKPVRRLRNARLSRSLHDYQQTFVTSSAARRAARLIIRASYCDTPRHSRHNYVRFPQKFDK